MDSDIGAIFVGASVTPRLLMDEFYGSKNAFLELMEVTQITSLWIQNGLSEIMDLYFQSLWI